MKSARRPRTTVHIGDSHVRQVQYLRSALNLSVSFESINGDEQKRLLAETAAVADAKKLGSLRVDCGWLIW